MRLSVYLNSRDPLAGNVLHKEFAKLSVTCLLLSKLAFRSVALATVTRKRLLVNKKGLGTVVCILKEQRKVTSLKQ